MECISCGKEMEDPSKSCRCDPKQRRERVREKDVKKEFDKAFEEYIREHSGEDK